MHIFTEEQAWKALIPWNWETKRTKCFPKITLCSLCGDCLLSTFLKLAVYFTDGKQYLDSPYLKKLTHIASFAMHTSGRLPSSLAVDPN